MKKFLVCFGSKNKIYHNVVGNEETLCGIPQLLCEGSFERNDTFYCYPPKGYKLCKNCRRAKNKVKEQSLAWYDEGMGKVKFSLDANDFLR